MAGVVQVLVIGNILNPLQIFWLHGFTANIHLADEVFIFFECSFNYINFMVKLQRVDIRAASGGCKRFTQTGILALCFEQLKAMVD